MKPEHRRAFDEIDRSLKTELLVARIGPTAYAALLERRQDAARRMQSAAKLRRAVMGPQERALAKLGRVEYERIRAQGRRYRREQFPVSARDCPYRRWTPQFFAWCFGAAIDSGLRSRKQAQELKRLALRRESTGDITS